MKTLNVLRPVFFGIIVTSFLLVGMLCGTADAVIPGESDPGLMAESNVGFEAANAQASNMAAAADANSGVCQSCLGAGCTCCGGTGIDPLPEPEEPEELPWDIPPWHEQEPPNEEETLREQIEDMLEEARNPGYGGNIDEELIEELEELLENMGE